MLIKYYTREDVLLEYDWPTSCVKHYTPLTIFCYKERYTKSDATAVARMLTSTGTMTHEYHGNVCGKVTENISDLFAPFEKFACSAYVILIEGTAGIGKSTLCKEIALQWAYKKVLKNQNVLFLLYMHDPKMKNLTNVELLVKHFLQSKPLANINRIIDWLAETDGKYLTIIIDGYSKDCENSFITDDIIGRKILTQCGLVITSRSATSSHLSKIVNQRALVMGFSKCNHITFLDTALKGSHSKINNHFKDYLHSNPLIDNLCNIPLIMTMLLWLVVDDEEINNMPKSQASLIQKYIMAVTKKKIIPSLINPHHPYDQMIKDLSQFAFIAIQEDQLTFTVEEISDLCQKNFQVYWDGPDFLSRIFKFGSLSMISFQGEKVDCELFYFSNLKIQEYLAAYYISLLPDSELLKLLHGTFWNICYLNVWILYVDISEGNNSVFRRFLAGSQPLGTSDVSVKTIKANGDLDNKFLGLDINLKHQDRLRTLAMLLSRSTNKQSKNLNLASWGINSQDCKILCEMLCSNTEFKFETVDISYNNFHWESFYTFCSMLKAWHTENFVFSIDMLYDTVTMNEINSFTASLKENFLNDESSNSVLLLTYIAKRSTLIAVYVAPTCIRWFHWNDCKLNRDMIKLLKVFIENKVGNSTFKLAFSYSVIDYHENLPTLLSDVKNIQLCGSYLHSKGAYLLNIASTMDYQYNSPQELVADYLAAVLLHNAESTTPYLESLPAAYVTIVKSSLQTVSVFDISDNYIDSQIYMATEIGMVLSLTRTLQTFNVSGNNLPAENIIRIATGLKNISTLEVFNINDNHASEEAADAIATVLSYNTQLQRLHLSNNKFKTIGMIKIAEALQNISTLTVLNISKNSIGEEAADDIASVLSYNTELQRLHLSNNNFRTIGMIKIAKALQNVLTLTVFNLNYNNIGEEAADDIATVLSHNTKLQRLHLSNNNFKTIGMIKIAKALQNVLALIVFNINNNNVGEEAADDIATALYQNTYLQELYLDNNSFDTVGMIKIAKVLQNISNLTVLSISNNNVGEEAADDIATVLSRNTQLKELHIRSNNIRTMGAIKITKALKKYFNSSKI